MGTFRQTFDKTERLCSRKIITSLFDAGNSLYSPLYKVIWDKSPVKLKVPAQVAFSVTKKGFRHAVTRNLLKRRMREAYRSNKHLLYEPLQQKEIQIVFIVIYRNNEVLTYQEIVGGMKDLLEKLVIKVLDSGKLC